MTGLTPALTHRDNNFDFMRFFLAAVVIFSHSFDLLVGSNKTNPFMIATHGQTEMGTLAVALFFILSGYLITQSFVTGRGLWDFMKKRVLRIYPAFVVSCLVCTFFFAPLGMRFYGFFTQEHEGYWHWVEWKPLLLNIATLQALWGPHTFNSNPWPYVNSAIWTIHYEFLCYLAVAALGIFGLLRKRWVVLGLFVCIWGFHLVHHYTHMTLYGPWGWAELRFGDLSIGGKPDAYPRFFTYFFAGSVFYLFRDYVRYTTALAVLVGAVVFVGLFVYPFIEFVMPLGGAYLALWFAFNKDIPLQRWGKFGDFSYGLYVFGWPVQQTIIQLTHRHISPTLLFLSAFAGTLVLAVASWYCVERPFLRLKSSRKVKPAGFELAPIEAPLGVPAKEPAPAAVQAG